MLRFSLSLLALLCLLSSALVAQTFPVSATVSVNKATVYPEDLARPGALIVQLQLRDARPVYVGTLVLVVRDERGGELRLTNPNPFSEIELRRGIPTVLTGSDLLPYFLNGGADAGAGLFGNRGGVLAEGMITVCAEFYDLNRPDVRVTDPADCGMAFAELHEPPQLLAPAGEVTANLQSALPLSWVPGHLGGPVEYTVELWELPPYLRSLPDAEVVRGLAPIVPPIRVPLDQTQLAWSSYHQLLEPGSDYVWRVRVSDPTGRLCFRENGYSAPVRFHYAAVTTGPGADCYTPRELELASLGGDRYRLNWRGAATGGAVHTLTVRERPGDYQRSVQLPTLDNGQLTESPAGPDGQRDYAVVLATELPLDGGGLTYAVELCVRCPRTGAESCYTVDLGTTGPDGDPAVDPTDDPVTDVDTQDPDALDDCEVYAAPLPALAAAPTPTGLQLAWAAGSQLGTGHGDYGYTLAWRSGSKSNPPLDSVTLSRSVDSYALDGLGDATPYLITLCAVCPAGQQRCRDLTATTAAYYCPTEDELAAAVTATGIPPGSVGVSWSSLVATTDPAGWFVGADLPPGQPPLDATATDGQKAMAAATGSGHPPYGAVLDSLDGGEQTVTVCYRCSDGSVVCTELTVEIPACTDFDLALSAPVVGFDEVQLRWQPAGEGDYSIAYAEAGGGDQLPSLAVSEATHTLGGLQPLTSYAITVCAPCGTTPICDTLTVTTTGVQCALAGDFDYSYSCGDTPEDADLNREELLTRLSPGDSIWAGDFLVEVTRADATGGTTFDGRGTTQVPYLNGVKLPMEFYAVEVNRNCRMVGGEMVVISPVTEALEQLDDLVGQALDLIDNIDRFLGQLSNALGVISQGLTELAAHRDRWAEINDFVDASTNAVTQIPYLPQEIIDELEAAGDCMKDVARRGGTDAEMEACEDRYQAALTAAQAFVDELFDVDFRVDFTPTADQGRTYGYDYQRYELIGEEYVTHEIAEAPYAVPWISSSTGAEPGNGVTAVRSDGGAMSEITFIGTDREEITGWERSGATATHPGLDAGGDQRERHVFAAIPNDTTGGKPPFKLAGQVSLVTYDPVETVVHIVPLAGVELGAGLTEAALRERLGAIFNPAVVDLEVRLEAPLASEVRVLHAIGSDPLSNYTAEMQELRAAVKRQDYHDRQHYYLVVVADMEPAGRQGFMPRKRHYGFLNGAALAGDVERFAEVAAHELAHGAYHLQHVFDRFPGVGEEETDNLLGYAAGARALYKYQWDNVHDPEANFTLFDEEEEGESVFAGTNFMRAINREFAIGKYLTFLSGQGEPVVLDTTMVTDLLFATGGERYVGTDRYIPVGSLIGFEYKIEHDVKVIYIGCADGNYYPQSSAGGFRSPATGYTCEVTGNYGRWVPSANDSGAGDPVVVRVVQHNGVFNLHAVQISNYVNDPENSSYDKFVAYFFDTDDSDDRIRTQGLLVEASGSASVQLSGEFYSPQYRAFLAKYAEYNEFERLSSFYLGALGLAIFENPQYFTTCAVTESPEDVLAAFGEFFATANITRRHFPRPTIDGEYSDFTRQIFDDIASTVFRQTELTELQEAQAFDLVEYIINGAQRVDYFQRWINDLDVSRTTDLGEYMDFLTSADERLHACEWDQIVVPVEKVNYITKLFLETGVTLKNFLYYGENGQESAMLMLFKKAEGENADVFLDLLATTQLSSGEHAWQALIDRIDADWIQIGDDNGARLMNTIIALCDDAYQDELATSYRTGYNTITSYLEADLEELLTDEDIDFGEMVVIPYHYQKLIARLGYAFMQGAEAYNNNYTYPLTGELPEPANYYVSTSVEVRPDGLFDVNHTVTQAVNTQPVTAPAAIEGMHPFQLILLDPTSTYRTVATFTGQEVRPYPACILYYLETVAYRETVTDGVITTLDVISLAVPGGALLKVGRVGRGLLAADKASSMLSLSASAIDATQPTDAVTQDLVRYINLTSGFLGISSLAGEGILRGNAALTVRELKRLGKTAASATSNVDRSVALRQFLTQTEELSPTVMVYLGQDTRRTQSLIRIIKREASELDVPEGTTLHAAVKRAIDRLKGAPQLAGLIGQLQALGWTSPMIARVSQMSNEQIGRIIADAQGNSAFRSAMQDRPDLVASWDALAELSFDLSRRIDIAGLEAFKNTIVAAEQLGFDIKQIIKVPGGQRVYKPIGRSDNPTDEIRLSEEIAALVDDDVVLTLVDNEPGIDGFYLKTGNPIQLKTVGASQTARNVVQNAKRAYEKAASSALGWRNVEVRIEAKSATQEEILRRWLNIGMQPKYTKPNDGVINSITVHCSDGVIRLPLEIDDVGLLRMLETEGWSAAARAEVELLERAELTELVVDLHKFSNLANDLKSQPARVKAWRVFNAAGDESVRTLKSDVLVLDRYVAALAREGDEVLAFIYARLGDLRPSARPILENEGILIDASHSLQSAKTSTFIDPTQVPHGRLTDKYLWTIDERGVNIAWELTPFPTPRGNIVHSNISTEAHLAGEAWFGPNNTVTINAGSGRFGDSPEAARTEGEWQAAVEFWENLGYDVIAVPFGTRYFND